MAEYLAPGVYVEEFDSGAKAMEGVSTSTAGLIGFAQRGPTMGKPVLITSIAQYHQLYGGHLDTSFQSRYLSYGIEQFFANGGSSCYVMRVAPIEDQLATYQLGEALQFQATSVGAWGNECHVTIQKEQTVKTNLLSKLEALTYEAKSLAGFEEGDLVELQHVQEEIDEQGNSSKTVQKEYNRIISIVGKTMTFEHPFQNECIDTAMLPQTYLYRIGFSLQCSCDGINEQYHVSLNASASDFIQIACAKSLLVKATFQLIQHAQSDLCNWLSDQQLNDAPRTFFLKGGTSEPHDAIDLYLGTDLGPGKRTGIASFKEISDVSMMLIPGVTYPEVQSALVAHCETMANRFAILDMPQTAVSVDDMLEHRSYFDTNFAAVYHPWLLSYDTLHKRNLYFPPSAAVAGIYARVDTQRGVHKAPANETLANCIGLSVNYNEAEQGKVNPKGVNLIRSLPGQGIRVWGARTMSSDASWKYINVRRLFIYLEESIRANTNWAVFEPNDANLWTRVESTIRMFLNTLWRNGALLGTSEDEAFFVNVGLTTMTQDDILNGRLICVIGVAPVRPAEFVIFRVTQKMQES